MTITIDKDGFLTLAQINEQLIVTVRHETLAMIDIQPEYIVGPSRFYNKNVMPDIRERLARLLASPN